MDARTTFTQLIERNGRVEIPVIQRDYAQGRTDQHDVRDDFLRAMHRALTMPADDSSLPLDLDFVYGSAVGGAFQPLDGQQRLTTLFLLHWYLAWVDGKLPDFRGRLVDGGKSRFGYQVRPSSKDFVDEMAKFDPGPFSAECRLVDLIEDQPWYIRSWRFDQTIQSALEVLGAMHVEFHNSEGLYERLVDQKNPAIAFQLLDLQSFDLSDELYIKMNARGKPLTPFETFKARFEQHLKNGFDDLQLPVCGSSSVAQFFAQRIDKEWSNFFWPYKDSATATFDNAIMNLLRVVILVTRDPEADSTTTDLADLRGSIPNTFTAFNEKKWLDQNLIVALVCLLERWSKDTGKSLTYLPENSPFELLAVFKQIINDPSKLTFQELVQFAGYIQFIAAAEGEIDRDAFGRWMRVVYNLSVNTDYNRPDDLRRSLSGLFDLKPWMADINARLVQPGVEVRGFFQPQVAEERLKAHLINLGDGWPERIRQAEQHHILKGQIGFLLRFSGMNPSDPDSQMSSLDVATAQKVVPDFDHYFACATRMLQDLYSSTATPGRLWERALLAVGDFLLQVGRNRSLLGTAEGPGSWKRLLRIAGTGELQGSGSNPGNVLKKLWDRLADDHHVEATLSAIVKDEPDVADWRRAMIDTPAVYDYCRDRMMRFYDHGIYPLMKSQMNGRHVELFTFCLRDDLISSKKLKSLKVDYWESSTQEDEPQLLMLAKIDDADFQFLSQSKREDDLYYLWLNDPKAPEKALAGFLAQNGFSIDDGYWTKTLKRDQLKAAVLDLDTAIAHLN